MPLSLGAPSSRARSSRGSARKPAVDTCQWRCMSPRPGTSLRTRALPTALKSGTLFTTAAGVSKLMAITLCRRGVSSPQTMTCQPAYLPCDMTDAALHTDNRHVELTQRTTHLQRLPQARLAALHHLSILARHVCIEAQALHKGDTALASRVGRRPQVALVAECDGWKYARELCHTRHNACLIKLGTIYASFRCSTAKKHNSQYAATHQRACCRDAVLLQQIRRHLGVHGRWIGDVHCMPPAPGSGRHDSQQGEGRGGALEDRLTFNQIIASCRCAGDGSLRLFRSPAAFPHVRVHAELHACGRST